VDRTLLPDICSLTVFIAGFRPLARRVGTHANLWFLGWGLLLLHSVALFFMTPNVPPPATLQLAATWTIDLCALVFILVSANVPNRRLGRWLMAAFSAPVLLQSAAAILLPDRRILGLLAAALYLAPATVLLFRRRERSHPTVVVCSAFAVFGPAMLPAVWFAPADVPQYALALLFLSAAYLYFLSADHHARGAIAAFIGLVGWGLSYPARIAMQHYFPDVPLDHTLLLLPRYLVVAGVILALLEEHVERTERLAMHDPLTDLPNRRLFEQRLIATMEEARINRTTVACLVIDVDNFKAINDTLGHSAGDQLLRALAVRLSWHMSPRDILARTGGDEFTALLAGVTDEHHLRFIASAMMSAGSVPIMIDGKPVDMHISIGIALSPDHADDIDSLRRAADQAMYSAKRKGGAMLAFADED
jgi:diguanylate cyclase (GGDEF)-like protein